MANRVVLLVYHANDGEFTADSRLDFHQLMEEGKLEKVKIDQQLTEKLAELKASKTRAIENSSYEMAVSLRDQERRLLETYSSNIPVGYRKLFVLTWKATEYYLVAPNKVIVAIENRQLHA
jgi:hypothetical protein